MAERQRDQPGINDVIWYKGMYSVQGIKINIPTGNSANIHIQLQLTMVEEKELLSFYGLNSLTPESWGSRPLLPSLDEDSISEQVISHLLDNSGNKEKEVTKSTTTTNLNTTDPLGFHESVLHELIDKDIIDDSRDSKKLKYLVDSKVFNPRLFLSIIHKDKSFNELQTSLRFLDQEMMRNSKSLQEIVQKEFTHFIKCKSSLDQVYSQFHDSNLTSDNNKKDLRNNNGTNNRETHIDTLSTSLNSSSAAMNMILNPFVESTSKEGVYKLLIQIVNENKFLFNLPSRITDHIEKNDYDSLINDYRLGKNQYLKIMNSKDNSKIKPMINKIWNEVEKIIGNYKKQLWEKLGNSHIENIGSISLFQNSDSNFLVLITRILQLGSDNENPIIEFINLQYDYIFSLITGDSSLIRSQLVRFIKTRQLISSSYTQDAMKSMPARYMFQLFTNSKHISSTSLEISEMKTNLPLVNDTWQALDSYISELTTVIIDKQLHKFGQIVDYFINGKFQQELSQLKSSVDKKYLIFENEEVVKLQTQYETLIYEVFNRLLLIFNTNGENLEQLLLSTNPGSSSSSSSSTAMDSGKSKLNDFGFIPSLATSISTLNYCLSFDKLISQSIKKLLSFKSNLISNPNELQTTLNNTLSKIIQNFIFGSLSVLISDQTNLRYVADWSSNSQIYQGCTLLPEYFLNFYEIVISKISTLISSMNYTKLSRAAYDHIQTQFINSLKVLLENIPHILKIVDENDKFDNEFRIIKTASNLQVLNETIVPKILDVYQMKINHSNESLNNEVYVTLDQYEIDLFTSFISIYRSKISKILEMGIKGHDWNKVYEPNTVSIYILELLDSLIVLKRNLINYNTPEWLSLKVQTELLKIIVDKTKNCIRGIQNFSSAGLLQISIDLKFLIEVFGISNYNPDALDLLKGIYKRMVSKVSGGGKSESKVNQILETAMFKNKLAMDCFTDLNQ